MAYIDIEKVDKAKNEIVEQMRAFINEGKEYSQSTVDYHGGKYEAMEIAIRLVTSILTDVIEQPTADVASKSEVANEIIDEIETILSKNIGWNSNAIVFYKTNEVDDAIAKLKKKHETGKIS